MYQNTQQIVIDMALKGYIVELSAVQDEISIHIKRKDGKKLTRSEEAEVFGPVSKAINDDMMEIHLRQSQANNLLRSDKFPSVEDFK